MGICFDAYKAYLKNIEMEDNLALLKNFSSLAEAELIKNLLEKEGVKSMIQRGESGAATEFSGAAGDADLFVKKDDFDKAREILGDI